MIINLNEKINSLIITPSDINEHIATIIEYGKQCEHITEMGVRGIVSTWGWLSTNPKKIIAYDIKNPSYWGGSLNDIEDTANSIGTEFKFYEANVLNVEIEETDLLFIDTWHSYKQLTAELSLHSKKVRKYICFHDTTTFANVDETSYESWGDEWKAENVGIWKAIEEFLNFNSDWVLEKRFINNNGFTIIKNIMYDVKKS
jgi:hypothetical protein